MDSFERRGPSPTLTASLGGLSLILWIALLGVLTSIVPRYRRAWDDVGQRLSPLAELTVTLSAWVADWWWVLPLAAVPGLLLAAWVVWAAGRSAPAWARVLLGLFVAVPALLLLAVATGLALG